MSSQPGPSNTNTKSPKKQKWTTLEHNGPYFHPPYQPLPDDVDFKYDGKPMKLSPKAEEVAGFYAKLLPIKKNKRFPRNFFEDWRKCMTEEEKQSITELSKCDFYNIYDYYSKPEKDDEEMKKMQNKHGFCKIDGREESIANYKVEPPGLFRGRGNHPKSGKLKKRIQPEHVTINCSSDCQIEPPLGHTWNKVITNNKVTWLACWSDNIHKTYKYIKLSPTSKLLNDFDRNKFETARKLNAFIEQIRANYRQDWESDDPVTCQRAVALFFIDKLALRCGNEKDEDETADTFGCCTLRCSHIELQENDNNYLVSLDFEGKASVPYVKKVQVEEKVFENLQSFMANKAPSDPLFHSLDSRILNTYLKEQMPDLTAKVFRTYNASMLLDQRLDELTNDDDDIDEKIQSCKGALRSAADLCNHRTNERIAPQTTMAYYLDPRIIVAWCKKHRVPYEKIYTRSLVKKFKWAIDEVNNSSDDWKFIVNNDSQ